MEEAKEAKEAKRYDDTDVGEGLAGMSIANGHLYVNGLIVAKVSRREQAGPAERS